MGPPSGPEPLIPGLFLIVGPFLVAYWVYSDAGKRGDDRAALWALAIRGPAFLGGSPVLVVCVRQR